MKKNGKIFAIAWAVVFVVCNAIIFLVPNKVMGITRFDKPVFWVSYALVALAMIGQLVVSLVFCKKDTAEKKFLGLSLLHESYLTVAVAAVIGVVFMTIPVIPAWVAAILCLVVLAFHIITAIKITAATEYVAEVGEKVKIQTQFIRTLSAEASTLAACAKSDDAGTAARQVYDAIRYSDPMSNDALADCEKEIRNKYNELLTAIKNDTDDCRAIADELLLLIQQRNAMCKTLK